MRKVRNGGLVRTMVYYANGDTQRVHPMLTPAAWIDSGDWEALAIDERSAIVSIFQARRSVPRSTIGRRRRLCRSAWGA
jgi:hypothetical protein